MNVYEECVGSLAVWLYYLFIILSCIDLNFSYNKLYYNNI